MRDPPPNLDAGTPRWVKWAGIVALLLIVLFVVVTLAGRGGSHGPGRHTGPPPGVTHQQP
jgi:hypothetical protein